VNRLVIKLNRKKTHLSSFIEWGYGEVLLQDIHMYDREDADSHLGGDGINGVNKHTTAVRHDTDYPTSSSITNQKSVTDNSDRNDDIWVPILRSTTGEQIGVMLISAIRTHVCNDNHDNDD